MSVICNIKEQKFMSNIAHLLEWNFSLYHCLLHQIFSLSLHKLLRSKFLMSLDTSIPTIWNFPFLRSSKRLIESFKTLREKFLTGVLKTDFCVCVSTEKHSEKNWKSYEIFRNGAKRFRRVSSKLHPDVSREKFRARNKYFENFWIW